MALFNLNKIFLMLLISKIVFVSAKWSVIPWQILNIFCLIFFLFEHYFPWTQAVNWTYVRRSKHVLHVFWTSYVRSIYVLYPKGAT